MFFNYFQVVQSMKMRDFNKYVWSFINERKWESLLTCIVVYNRVIRKVCLEEETKGKFHQNWD
jgi:hypothetical protein